MSEIFTVYLFTVLILFLSCYFNLLHLLFPLIQFTSTIYSTCKYMYIYTVNHINLSSSLFFASSSTLLMLSLGRSGVYKYTNVLLLLLFTLSFLPPLLFSPSFSHQYSLSFSSLQLSSLLIAWTPGNYQCWRVQLRTCHQDHPIKMNYDWRKRERELVISVHSSLSLTLY